MFHIKKLWNAFLHSISGLKYAWINEWAFRVEIILTCIFIFSIKFLAQDVLHGFILLFSMLFVLICELFNSAIEAVVDRVSLDRHPLAKAAKDLASAGVFMSCVFCLALWGWSVFSFIN